MFCIHLFSIYLFVCIQSNVCGNRQKQRERVRRRERERANNKLLLFEGYSGWQDITKTDLILFRLRLPKKSNFPKIINKLR